MEIFWLVTKFISIYIGIMLLSYIFFIKFDLYVSHNYQFDSELDSEDDKYERLCAALWPIFLPIVLVYFVFNILFDKVRKNIIKR